MQTDKIFISSHTALSICYDKVSHKFSDYGPGLRFISFEHGGQDTKYWDGWYGVRVTASSVTLEAWERKEARGTDGERRWASKWVKGFGKRGRDEELRMGWEDPHTILPNFKYKTEITY